MNMEAAMKEWVYSFKVGRLWLTAVQADRSGSEHTQIAYSRSLKEFCNWIKKNPDQLIAERKAELKNEETAMNTENKLREFCIHLEKERKLSRTTVATKYHAAIKSFFMYSCVPLKLKTPRYVLKERQPHTHNEIKALLAVADVREKAIIMLLKDSGISREDIVALKYGMIQNEMEENQTTVHIKMIRTKESVSYDTFIGSNAIEALKAYIEYRKRRGEEIDKDSYLIAQLNGKPTTDLNISQMFVRLGKKAGFYTSPHRFRKFFESHLALAAPSILVRYWMGHSLGVEKSYFLPPIEKQRQKYAEAYKEIDLSETKVIEEVEALKLNGQNKSEEIEKLRSEIERLKHDMLEIPRNAKRFIERVRSGEFDHETEKPSMQKVIDENELATHLGKGWKFVSVLPSKKILVAKT